ncbi:DNA polymerase III subunit alpha [Mycoplasmopsis caviae]|uniref:DNA-directed DNA polymerase n=1 Tax=Mycoplasmopsis caviae TaxID=55603 RepID=A0A3P8LAG2_9BACT|nr:DNA polymerase III subunit alpha [Mycoplasmopsis caviae]UUD35516.1 DNA polymerase III subunit alpha [Mycoplasmopsis caviae]VDR41711.1 DNA polymerase III alpha subunit [Mycoplasmopsis caviae]
MKKYVNLYNTTEYTFLDSLIKVDDLVRASKEKNLPAVVLSDHNNLFGLGAFMEACLKYDIKGIIGVDLDVQEYRFIILAKNYVGFQKINQLIYKKSKGEIIEISELWNPNLIVLDHPRYGYYAQTQDNKFLKAKNYYINSSDASLPNSILIKENKLFNSDDNETLNYLQKLANLEETKHYSNYFDDVSVDEIIIERIYKIIDECNVVFPKKELHLAPYLNNDEQTNEELFVSLLKQGSKRLASELSYYPQWNKRLEYEFNVIKKLGYINYFLIIQDLINWAKSQKIAIGPGRGSASGSLVSYLLNITEINPLKYNLLFERFLNPERVSWPDIDIDIQDDRRQEVFDYLRNKYGSDKVALISTFQTIGAKMAIRDMGRVMGISLIDINRISKTIKSDNLSDAYQNDLDFKIEMDNYPELYKHALRIEGLPRQQSFHAAGFIIADDKLYNYVPLCQSNLENFQQVQVPMNYIESFGLLKIDLLGLRTLSEIQLIEKSLEEEQKFDNLVKKDPQVLNDPSTMMMLNSGFTEGIFQLESPGMKKTIQKVMLNSFDDLYAIISLFRPGPMEFITTYAENKKSNNLVRKIHPEYDKIVASTHGIIVYQEQIMQIAQSIGGMSFSQADLLRKAISKKNQDEIKKYRGIFFENAYKTGISEKIINTIYNNIEKFGLYGFNKSHAVSYAYLTMKMSYYKTRYTHLFYSSLITNAAGAQATINKYVNEIKKLTFPVYSPNILYSSNKCEIRKEVIYLPFEMIKGFGAEGVNKIMADLEQNGPYKNNLIDTMLRLRFAGIKDSAMETLIKANVFRDFGHTKHILQCDGQIKDIFKVLSSHSTYKEAISDIEKMGYFNITFDEEIKRDIFYEMDNETALLGELYNAYSTSEYEAKYQNKLITITTSTPTKVAVEVADLRKPRGKEFSILELRDSTTKLTFFVSNKTLANNFTLKKGQIIEATISFNRNKHILLGWKGIN